ncbi:MmgE/PrpD family protein [Paraburkholderia kururiensis]|uniref:MmgE/PrpD family protein n=1 Tax=Paraburkholderia kururiensis TaxID=984307 RepID=A0ABZ0WLG6_9BURK|nr:MmgE/PrpD family protein [Paraburkholderia kururiensis]WQD78217.1 MmgE/PrpD family protein [Paraburkholderia kururiensis]
MQADLNAKQVPREAAVTHVLSRFVSSAQWRDIPREVRHEAKRALVNYFAVALAGARDPMIDKAMEVYGRFSAGRYATLIGRDERMDMLNAASLNAMSANVFDFDDTHIPTIIHPTAPIAAALFALAECRPMTGEALLLSFVEGVEAACRIGNAVSPEHYQRGWHITSTCGVFGAAAAVARALALDAKQTGWALGHASGQAGGLVETLGTMSKSVSVGNAARNGLISALLAKEGLAGPDAPLEGPRGFLAVACSHADTRRITEGLGREWALLSNTYKPYPCGVVLNPVIDACLDLRRDARWTLDEIESIEIVGHPLLRERTDRPGVRTGRESQVSAQHAVAVALSRGKAALAEFRDDAVSDPVLRALGRRLRFIDDPAWQVEAAQVTLVLRSGERLTHRVLCARGSLGAPLVDVELSGKLRDLAAYGATGVAAQPLLDLLWALDTAPDAAAPMRAARAAP